jgi:hypothetical protein
MDTQTNKERFLIRWITRDKRLIERIRQRFNIPHYTTVNGYSPIEVSEEDMPVLQETKRRGFIGLNRDITWCKKGEVFVFISRQK